MASRSPGGPAPFLISSATVTFTGLPADLGTPSFAVQSIDGFDDNADGVVDGFGFDAELDFGDITLGLEDTEFLSLTDVTLGVSGFEVRSSGVQADEFAFSASGLGLLPGGLPFTIPLPDVGSIDVATGAFSLEVPIDPAASKALTFGGLVPLDISRVAASYLPAAGGPDASFSITGSLATDGIRDQLRSLTESPELDIALEVFDGGSWTLAGEQTVGLDLANGTFRLTDTPPIRASVIDASVALPNGLGTVELTSFELALGAFDGTQLVGMPSGSGYEGQQIGGAISATATTSVGTLTGTIDIAGSLAFSESTSTLDLDLTGTLDGDLTLAGFTGTGSFGADLSLVVAIDAANGSADFAGTSFDVDSFRASDLELTVADLIRLDIDQINYVANPAPGDPIASVSGVNATLLGPLADANLSSSILVELYDDDGDEIVDGIGVTSAEFVFAPGQSYDFGDGPLLRVRDLAASFDMWSYRPASGSGLATGTIDLSLGLVELYPDGGGAFSATVSNATGEIDPATGEVQIEIGSIDVSLGDGNFFEISLDSTTITLDSDDTTDIISVDTATLRLNDPQGDLDPVEFEISDFRFNLVGSQTYFGIGSVSLWTASGLTPSLGLVGVLPFNVTNASLNFDPLVTPFGTYSDFTSFTLDVEGNFDLSLLESSLGFTPTLTIGGNTPPNGFEVTLGFDVAEGRVEVIDLQDVTIGFSGFEVGEFVFAGEIAFDGIAGGVLQPGVGGFLSIDGSSQDNRVSSSTSGTGVDLLGAQIGLSGDLGRTGDVTTLTVDVSAAIDVQFRLGDFLEVSGLGFDFGLDIAVQDGWVGGSGSFDVTPRLESLSVDAITANVGEYVEIGAQDLTIDFDPSPGDPLVVFDFAVSSPQIGIGGSISNLSILEGGVPDFAAIDRVDVTVTPGSAIDDLFSEFMPLNVNRVGFAFQPGFFELGPGGEITGIADGTALNLFVSGRAGTPDWWPSDFSFTAATDFSDVEIDVTKLLAANPLDLPIVSLSGLGFEVGIDVETFTAAGAISFGMVDNPVAGQPPVYYAAVRGEFEFSDFGATGVLALTTAGPIGASVAVPLSIVLGQTGITISGAAGTLQFGTISEIPNEINDATQIGSDILADLQNPFDIDFTSVSVIEQQVEQLWMAGTPAPTWTQPATLALQGEVTHVAVAGLVNGTVTVGLNVSLPNSANPAEPGLALLGFGSINALGIPIADAKLLANLRDPLQPFFAFRFEAPASSNPLGMLFPADANFEVAFQTKGVAMAAAVGLGSFFQSLGAQTLDQGQLFFETVMQTILTELQNDPNGSRLADALTPFLQPNQTFDDLDSAGLISLLTSSLNIQPVLDGLALNDGVDVDDLSQALQDSLAAAIEVYEAAVFDLTNIMPRVIAENLDDQLDEVDNLIALGLREASQAGDPLDPLGLVNKLAVVERLVPLVYVSEAVSVFTGTLADAFADAVTDTSAFVVSPAFDPRLLITGEVIPTLLGIPIGDRIAGALFSVGKSGVSIGYSGSVSSQIAAALAGFSQYGPFAAALIDTLVDDSYTDQLEFPVDTIEVVQDLANGQLPFDGLNPFDPSWSAYTDRSVVYEGVGGSLTGLLFGPDGSLLFDQWIRSGVALGSGVDGNGNPVEPGEIPISSQVLIDRMLDNGGAVFNASIYHPLLLTDPYAVYTDILSRFPSTDPLVDENGTFDWLQGLTLFNDSAAFLSELLPAIKALDTFAEVTTYLPFNFEMLLPDGTAGLPDLRALLASGDIQAFNQAFLGYYVNTDGSINSNAVSDSMARIASQFIDPASATAQNFFAEGFVDGSFLGFQLIDGQVFAGLRPDPDDPNDPTKVLELDDGGLTLTGEIPWLGGLVIDAYLDSVEMDLTDPALQPVRDVYGDLLRLPRARIDLGTNELAGQINNILAGLGLDIFAQIPAGGADAALRAYTPGYDLNSPDALLRVGGIEFFATLDIPGLVDGAEFTFRVAPPGPTGGPTFAATASVDELTLGAFNLTNAQVQLVQSGTQLEVIIDGQIELLGSTFSVSGTLDQMLQGSLELEGTIPAGFFGGLSVGANTALGFTSDQDGVRIEFSGSVTNLPGVGGSVVTTGEIESNDSFELDTTATNITLAPGFTVSAASLKLAGDDSSFTIGFSLAGGGSLSVLGSTFSVTGTLDESLRGALDLVGTLPSGFFGGLSASGSLQYLSDTTDGERIEFSGSITNIPGVGGSVVTTGKVENNDSFTLETTATNITLAPGFVVSGASLELAGGASSFTIGFSLAGGGSLAVLGSSFAVDGTLDEMLQGSLSLGGAIPSGFFGGLSASGALIYRSPAIGSQRVDFFGGLTGIPGVAGGTAFGSGSIDANGNFSIDTSATDISFGGFTVDNALLEVSGNTSTYLVDFGASGTGSLSILGATFSVAGAVDFSGTDVLELDLVTGTPNFAGFDVDASFELEVTGSSATVMIDAVIDNIPGFVDSLAMSGTVSSAGFVSLSASVAGLTLAPNDVTFGLAGGSIWVDISGTLELTGTQSSMTIGGSGTAEIRQGWVSSGFPPDFFTQTLFAGLDVDSLEIRSNGFVSMQLSDLFFEYGIFDLTASSVGLLHDPSNNTFRLDINGPTLSASRLFRSSTWIATGFNLSVNLNLDGDFAAQIVDGDNPWTFGGFELTGTDLWIRSSMTSSGRTFEVRIEDDFNRTSRLRLPGNLNDLAAGGAGWSIPDIVLASNGTFSITINNPVIGVDAINVSASTMRFERTGTNFSNLRLYIAQPTINLSMGSFSNSAVINEPIQFSADASFLTDSVENLATSLLNFGSAFNIPTSQLSRMDFRLDTTSNGWLFSLRDGKNPSLNLTSGSSVVLSEFVVSHDGSFTGTVSGQAAIRVDTNNNNIPDKTLEFAQADITLARSASSSFIQLDINNLELDIGFLDVEVSGFIRSNGDFSIIANSSLSTSSVNIIDFPTLPGGVDPVDLTAQLTTTVVIDFSQFGSSVAAWKVNFIGSIRVTAPDPFNPRLKLTLLDLSGNWVVDPLGTFAVSGGWLFDL